MSSMSSICTTRGASFKPQIRESKAQWKARKEREAKEAAIREQEIESCYSQWAPPQAFHAEEMKDRDWENRNAEHLGIREYKRGELAAEIRTAWCECGEDCGNECGNRREIAAIMRENRAAGL